MPDGRTAECRSQQHERPRCDADLPLQRDGLLATDDRKTGFHARHRAAFDVDHVREARLEELLARLLASAPGTTDDVQRFVGRAVASLHQRRRIELVQRDVPGDFDVDLPKFDGRAHVDEVDLLAFLAEFRKLCGLIVVMVMANSFRYSDLGWWSRRLVSASVRRTCGSRTRLAGSAHSGLHPKARQYPRLKDDPDHQERPKE